MVITPTSLHGCFIIQPKVFEDHRGYFFESYNQKDFENAVGGSIAFVQDNQSFSKYGTIRGLHAQAGEFAQAKLVWVISGRVLDVVVDARPGSPTYGQHVAVELSDQNKLQLFIPRGFLHGYSVLSEEAIFFYKCDNYYDKASETGIRFDDPFLNIDWRIPEGKQIVSEKDLLLKSWEEVDWKWSSDQVIKYIIRSSQRHKVTTSQHRYITTSQHQSITTSLHHKKWKELFLPGGPAQGCIQ